MASSELKGCGDAGTGTRPPLSDIVERAAHLRPLLAGRMARTEAEGRVSSDISRQLNDAGVYRACQPARFGGYEYGPSALFELGFELGRGCGSTGWCAAVSMVNAWMVSYWPLRAQEEIWGSDPRALVIGVFAPTGKAERIEGGYSVHGEWAFASNCDNAEWIAVGAALPPEEGRPPDAGWFMIPSTAFSVDHQSWQVMGMQGTGSKTVAIRDTVRVPDHMMIRISDVLGQTTPGATIPENPMARFSFATFGSAGLVAPLLGSAQAALDWFVEAMRSKVQSSLRMTKPSTAAHNIHNQIRIGAASAMIDAAKSMLSATLSSAEQKVFADQQLAVEERLRVRRDIVFAARQAVGAVNMLFEGAGASGARVDAPIQTIWRNVNAGARHATLDVEQVYGLYGEQRFGFDPVGQF